MAGSDVRIVLLGKTGVGKSASGNTILGTEEFVEESSPVSVTSQCRKCETKVSGRKVVVVDTPGLFDTSLTNEEMKEEIVKCVYMTVPGPHVFLLVIRLGTRFTQEEQMTMKWIQENFSKQALKYALVLFTGEDAIDIPVEDYIEKSPALNQLIIECEGRFHAFDNKKKDRLQVTRLLAKIDKMVKANGGQHYTDKMYLEAQRKIQEDEERKSREEEMKRQEEERKREEEQREKMEAMKKELERQEKQRREEDRKRFEEENRKRVEEERKRREEDRREYERRREEDRKRSEEQERRRLEEERKSREKEKKEWEKKQEEERKRLVEENRQRLEEERKRREVEERKRKEEDVKRQEEERKRQEEQRKKEEAMRKELERQEKQRSEEENRRRLEDESRREEERKSREEEKKEWEKKREAEKREEKKEREEEKREEERKREADRKRSEEREERRREEEKERQEEREREAKNKNPFVILGKVLMTPVALVGGAAVGLVKAVLDVPVGMVKGAKEYCDDRERRGEIEGTDIPEVIVGAATVGAATGGVVEVAKSPRKVIDGMTDMVGALWK